MPHGIPELCTGTRRFQRNGYPNPKFQARRTTLESSCKGATFTTNRESLSYSLRSQPLHVTPCLASVSPSSKETGIMGVDDSTQRVGQVLLRAGSVPRIHPTRAWGPPKSALESPAWHPPAAGPHLGATRSRALALPPRGTPGPAALGPGRPQSGDPGAQPHLEGLGAQEHMRGSPVLRPHPASTSTHPLP